MNEWQDYEIETDVSVGYWIESGLKVVRKTTVGSLVPAGFGSYARILCPVQIEGTAARWVRWSDIARHLGKIAHSAMELHALLGGEPQRFRVSESVTSAEHVHPWDDQVETLGNILAEHTRTPEECWFAFWEGNTAFQDLPADTPKLEIDGYRYILLRGSSSRAKDRFRGLTPNLWWPADRAWCVAAHFDFPCVYVGGTEPCIDGVLESKMLEAWMVGVDQTITADSDHLNLY